MRLYRENLALKVQLDALAAEFTRVRGKRARVSLRTRASQVWGYLVTRGNVPFQKQQSVGFSENDPALGDKVPPRLVEALRA